VRRLAAPAGGFRHIAVLRLSSLGDVVLTLPVVHALARAFPAARLSYWTKEEYADVVAADPAVGHVRRLERDARRLEDLVSMSAELEDCDLIVDLHGSLRARMLAFRQRAPVLRAKSCRLHRARWVRARWSRPGPVPPALARFAAALRPLGLDAPGPPRMSVDAAAEAWAAGRVGDGPAPLALCPGARHATKRWPEEHWVALVQALRARGVPLVALALPAERRALPGLETALAGDPAAWCSEPLPRMAALLSRCRAAVTHDSGLMHVAAARGLRVAALFGSTSPVLGFAPAGAGHEVLCREEPCQPCTLHGLAQCPLGHFRCMRELAPGQVLAALERMGVLAG
jgi:ADP-heptose:LPS heptosyltransferase